MKRRERYSIRSFFVSEEKENTKKKNTKKKYAREVRRESFVGGARRRRRRRRSIQDMFWFRRSESDRVWMAFVLLNISVW